MKITSIMARAVDCGFNNQKLQTSRVASPMSKFARFVEQRASWMWPTKKVFVRVEDESGTVGWGCTNGGEVVELIINSHLARLLEGEVCEDIATLNAQMSAALLPNDRSGFAMMAVAGVDIALWDLQAKSSAGTLVEQLGGSKVERLPVYMTTSRPEAFDGIATAGLKAAAPYGPESGREGLEANVALMKRFAEAAGPDVPIMIDAFLAWDADYTLRFAEAMKDIPIAWIEDPIHPQDVEGLQKIRDGLDSEISLALGNFAFSKADCADLLRTGVVGILQPDVAWAGGITETLEILDLANEAKVPVILHNTCEQPWALALAATRQGGALVECVDRGEESLLYELIGLRPKITDGHVPVPRNPAGNRPPNYALEAFDGAAIDTKRG
ncbi:mandelate racemase/muconate lactonizing enzyme family protein [Halocynthiibacter sp. C4]|uniref:mandelate racemase/muconate lactonizing enzyme family protein n=1 Tax=Halocynthiibacter sp. C4 TaxID=2992758 RepID=UPI00237B175A|nr:mandelate racemase/muconate lactonizing enzyme family protein [Halocynthiibacter sp. C4]MDE0589010.1 mandelate racemase/muconate lactonizing enzyme family protein [Halocynthiibacter sp. C4]